MANLADEYKKNTTDRGLGVLIDGVELYSPSVTNETIYFGEIDSVDIINVGKNYDIVETSELEVQDIEGFGSGAKVYGNLKGTLTDVVITSPGIGYEKKPTLNLIGGNLKGSIELETNLVKKVITSYFSCSLTGVANTTITFIGNHNFEDGDEIIYDTNSTPSIVGLVTSSSYFAGIINSTTISLYNTNFDALNKINQISGLNVVVGVNSGVQSFYTKKSKNVIDQVYIKNYDAELYSKTVKIPSVSVDGSVNNNGININEDYIYAENHNLNEKDLVVYKSTGSVITGLGTTSQYYVTIIDKNRFKLSDAGLDKLANDLNYQQKNYVNLSGIGTGVHTFNYPPIEIITSYISGSSYANPPVLKPIVLGSFDSIFIENHGVGYGLSEVVNYQKFPNIYVKNVENVNSNFTSQAVLDPVIVSGKIVDVVILNGGTGYGENVDIVIGGSGKYAKLYPNISEGKLVSVTVISSGTGYNKKDTHLYVQRRGVGAKFIANVKRWTINQYFKNKQVIDNTSKNGYIIPSRNLKNSLQFINFYPSRELRESVGDTPDILKSSPILGWAYDGNPIFGPYVYENNQFKIIDSSYSLKSNLIDLSNSLKRPLTLKFPSGYFIEDYEYIPDKSPLDEHNGMFIRNRSEFPEGTYAYFMTIDDINAQNPVYPYIIGPYFKNKPNTLNYDINYNQNIDITQEKWIKNTSSLYLNSENSGYEYLKSIDERYKQDLIVKNVLGFKIESIEVIEPGDNYKVGDNLVFSVENVQDILPNASVSRINGKVISNIQIGISTYTQVRFKNNQGNITGITTVPHNIDNNEYVYITNTNFNISNKSNKVSVKSKIVNLISNHSASGVTTYIQVNDITGFTEGDFIQIDSEISKIIQIYPKQSKFFIHRLENIGIHTANESLVTLLPNKFEFIDSKIIDQLSIDNQRYFNSKYSVGLGTTGSIITDENSNSTYHVPEKCIYIPNHSYKTNDAIIYSTYAGTNGLLVSDTPTSSTYRLTNNQTIYAISVSNNLIGISTVAFGLTSLTFRESSYNNDEIHSFNFIGTSYTGKVELNKLNVTTETPHLLLNNDLVRFKGEDNTWEYHIVKLDLNEEYPVIVSSASTFSVNLKQKPQFISYPEENSLPFIEINQSNISYSTNSNSTKGGIGQIKVISSGNSYKEIPLITSITSDEGADANLIALSSKIGIVDTIERVKDGFDYPSDVTLQPKLSTNTICYLNEISRVNKVNVIYGGSNYNTPPDLKVIGNNDIILSTSLKNYSVSSVSIDKNVNNLAKPLDIIAINNSNGFDIVNIIQVSSNINRITLDINQFPLIYRDYAEPIIDFPFEVGDYIFIENCRIEEVNKNPYNSVDNGYSYYEVVGINTSIGQIEYSTENTIISNPQYGTYSILNGYGTVVNKKNIAKFEMLIEKSNYMDGEIVKSYDIFNNIKFSGTVLKNKGWDKKRSRLKITKSVGNLDVGDILYGSDSLMKGRVIYSNSFNMKANFGVKRDKINYKDNISDLNSDIKRLQDSNYYQDFSYSIRGKTPYNTWKESVKSIVHPSGFKEFSDLQVISKPINKLKLKTQENNLDFKIEIQNENSFFTRNNYTICYENENINSNLTERVYFGSGGNLWPIAGYGSTLVEGISILPYILNKSNSVIPLKNVESEFTGTYDSISLGEYNVTFDSNSRYYLGISTVGLQIGDLIGFSTYHEYPYNTKIISIGINSVRTLYPHKLLSGSTTQSLNIQRNLNQNTLSGITTFRLVSYDNTPIYKVTCTPTGVSTVLNSIQVSHNFQTGQIVYYENIGGTPIGIGTTDKVIGGISTNILPSKIYVSKLSNNEFKLAGLSTSENFILTSQGSGVHKFIFDNPSASTLISIDNVIQSPLAYGGFNLGLTTSVGIGTSIIYISSGISSVYPNDILKIENEYLKINSIGLNTTNSIEVDRAFLGTIDSDHSGILTATVYKGNYLISEDIIYFTSPPFGPSGLPDNQISSKFSGRFFSRTFSSSRPNDVNFILDDISSQFVGVSSFNLTQNGVNVVGLYTNTNDPNGVNISNNPFILINNVPQITHDDFEIIEINQNKIDFIDGSPKSGKILKVDSTAGYGYIPLVGAAATVLVSVAGTISQVFLNGPGSGYRVPPVIDIISEVGSGASIVATVGSSGTITSLSVVNPGAGYTTDNIPQIVIDTPIPYYNLELTYDTSSTGIGSDARINLTINSDSTLKNFEIIESGQNYKVGDVLNVVGIVTNSGIGSSFNKIKLTVKEVVSDTFSGFYPGQFIQFDDISNRFDSSKKVFDITTTVNGELSRISFKNKDNNIKIENNFFIFINDVLQDPIESYRYFNGRIEFKEAPAGGSKCNILYYQGSIDDIDLVVPIQTIKDGDIIKFEISELNESVVEQSERVVKRLVSANSLDTYPYSGPGISKIVRPISWTKQKNDRIISGSLISKSRSQQSSKLYPNAKLIWKVNQTDTSIYVDNAYPLFIELDDGIGKVTEENRNVKIVNEFDFELAILNPVVSGASTISSVAIQTSGFGYKSIPTISISNPQFNLKDPLYEFNITSGISTSSTFNSITQGDVVISVGSSNLVAISTNLTSWSFDSFNANPPIDLQKINKSVNNTYIAVGSNGKITLKPDSNSSWVNCGIKTEVLGPFNQIIGLSDSTYSGTFNDVIYNENIDSWIVVGNGGKIYKGVGIGTTVFVESNSQNYNYKSIAYNSTIMIAVGHQGISKSEDGRNWFNVQNIPTAQYNSVIWNGEKFITASTSGIYESSNNGLTWSSINGSPTNLVKMTRYNEAYIGLDSSGNAYVSIDLTNWSNKPLDYAGVIKEITPISLANNDYITLVGTSGTIFYSTPITHPASITASVSGNVISSISVTDGGFGYSPINPPNILIETPAPDDETLYTIKAIGDYGKIVGIKTSNTGIGTNSPSIKFELLTDYSVSGYDSLNVFGITYSQLSIGDYFIISNSNVSTLTGYALTGITTSLGGMSNYPTSKVGTASTYLDGVYKVEYVETPTAPLGIVTVTCHIYPVNGGIGINTSGISTNYYGNYSWSKIYDYENRSTRNPLAFVVNTDNGLSGLATSPVVYRIPPLLN